MPARRTGAASRAGHILLLVIGLVLAQLGAARADDLVLNVRLEDRLGELLGAGDDARGGDARFWQQRPGAQRGSLAQKLVVELADLGNQLGAHLDVLSLELIALRFNARQRSMHVGFGGGHRRYLSFRMDSDFVFGDSAARVNARIDLCIAGRTLVLELPELELLPSSFRGERGIEVRLPLIDQRF